MTKRIWILGAADPEMAAIEALLRECGERVEHATVHRDGSRRRVTPGEAYAPDVAIGSDIRGLDVTAYAVECTPVVLFGSPVEGIDWAGVAHRIDHHRPGDPGYGRPPAEFLSASSIGQVIAELARLRRLPASWVRPSWAPTGAVTCGAFAHMRMTLATQVTHQGWIVGSDVSIEIPDDLVLAAAADHCLGAAYRGECPGADPDALMQWRAKSRAAFQKRPVEELLADIDAARKTLENAPLVTLLGMATAPHTDDHDWSQSVCDGCAHVETEITARDLRGIPGGVPELPEAACRDGIAYLASVTERDGREKVVLGAATAEQVQAFLRDWAPEEDLVDTYGDPARGFAGGYLPAAGCWGR